MHAPQQERSRRTVEAILDAAEALLEKRRFEEISIAEIILQAGASTGSFYARFPSKEALLPALYARYDANIPEQLVKLQGALGRRKQTLASVCRHVIDGFAYSMELRPNLMRAMTLYSRARKDQVKAIVPARAKGQDMILALFEPFRSEIRHADQAAAIRTALFVAGTMLREAIVFPDAPLAAVSRRPIGQLKAALTTMMVAYLRSDGGEP